ncbi:DUF4917 family protein [Microbacterium sp. NPDC090281]|uniref:DUF4917 family protein n=1 Tax=Microbacterium sp. NPDC090281 TaxID=3364208 RepID=UPI0038270C5E
MPKIKTFQAALDHADNHADEVSVLLGNGFSIDYDPTIFKYESLAEEANLSDLSVSKEALFGALGSSNFEVVIDRLKSSAAIEELYGGSAARAEAMKSDARVVRNGLADVLATRHPARAHNLEPDQIVHARRFLANFSNIYTLNYDLLLYWVVMATEHGSRVPKKDGFGWVSSSDHSLIWSSTPTQRQRIFYLHGALHLFVEDRRLHKMSYNESGPIVGSIRRRLRNGDYPLVVTEGSSEDKRERIGRSAYLRTGLNRFGEQRGALFVHGMSMHENDSHILERLEAEDSNITRLYVGVHGTAESRASKKLIERSEDLAQQREKNGGRRLRIKFYDTSSASVWRDSDVSD